MAEVSRLQDLRRLAPAVGNADDDGEEKKVGVGGDIELGQLGRAEQKAADGVAAHVREYVPVKENLERVKDATEAIFRLREEMRQAVSDGQRGRIQEKCDGLQADVKKLRVAIGERMKSIKGENAKYRKGKETAATTQMRDNLFSTYYGQFQRVMNEFSRSVEAFNNSMSDDTKRRLRVVTKGKVDDDTLDEIVRSGNAKEIIAQAVSADLDNVVLEIEERHLRIKRLEQQIREVYELFKDLAYLVDLQQESLDVIENRVSKAKGYTGAAVKELHKAEEHQKTARKRQCYIIILICIILIAVLVPVLSK